MSLTREPWDELCDALDPKGCRVISLPQRVWLFGGPCAKDNSAPPTSFRDSFSRACLDLIGDKKAPPWIKDLDQPENSEEWWAFSGYDNLLEFERDAAYLSRAVVLFSESPGSLAELGAFAVDDTLVQRLIVVVEQQFIDMEQISFLNLGPLMRVRKKEKLCVIDPETRHHLSPDTLGTVVDFISEKLPEGHKSELFVASNPTHRLLLIADLVDLLLVSKVDDVAVVLRHFGVDVSLEQLNRLLNVLHFFGLVRIQPRGSEIFLTAPKGTSSTWIDYTAASGKSAFDRSQFKVSAVEYVKSHERRNSIYGRKL